MPTKENHWANPIFLTIQDFWTDRAQTCQPSRHARGCLPPVTAPRRLASHGWVLAVVAGRAGLPGRRCLARQASEWFHGIAARKLSAMPANPMLEEVDAAEIGKKVGVAAAKGAGKAGMVAGKGAGRAGVAVGKASKRAAVEGKVAYKKRQDEKKNVSVCRWRHDCGAETPLGCCLLTRCALPRRKSPTRCSTTS